MSKRSGPGRMVLNILLVIVLVVVAIALIFVAYGRENTWVALFGPPDLGPVDFATLRNKGLINQYLICPEGYCPAARPAAVSPIFTVSPGELRAAVIVAAEVDDRVVQVSGEGEEELRFVARSNLMRYPDTVSVRVLPAEGGSTLAIYSRSQIGRSDFGVNKARIERWLERIRQAVGG